MVTDSSVVVFLCLPQCNDIIDFVALACRRGVVSSSRCVVVGSSCLCIVVVVVVSLSFLCRRVIVSLCYRRSSLLCVAVLSS